LEKDVVKGEDVIVTLSPCLLVCCSTVQHFKEMNLKKPMPRSHVVLTNVSPVSFMATTHEHGSLAIRRRPPRDMGGIDLLAMCTLDAGRDLPYPRADGHQPAGDVYQRGFHFGTRQKLAWVQRVALHPCRLVDCAGYTIDYAWWVDQ
jgi:hypothetical protein